MTNKRGGAGRGQGRKSLSPTEPTVTICLRMPESLRDKLERLGKADGIGKAEWVRRKVDKARETSDD